MKTDLEFVGKPINNVDGIAKAMGKARYVGDIQIPGMLYARVLRSPFPHARIVKLDVSPALKVPGVAAVITSDDFVNHSNYGWPFKDSYMLAYQVVRYVGDPIAVVAAENLTAAEAGIKAIQIEYEELPGVFDITHSLDPDAPLVPVTPQTEQGGNLCDTIIVHNGDPASLLAKSPVVVNETYWMHHQEHAYIETEGALAIPFEDDSFTVYVNTQSIFITQGHIAQTNGIPLEKIRVIHPAIGGSFGGKDDIGYQHGSHVVALARKTGRPVRLTTTREESILASYKREAMKVDITLGAETDGTLKAADVKLLVDTGAYSSMTSLAAWRGTVHAAGAYRYDAVKVNTQVVFTNNGYSGAFRGFGNTEATATIEQAIDQLAARLNRDPLDLRLQNCLRQGDRTMAGNTIDHPMALTDCLKWVRKESDWDKKRAEYTQQPASQELRRGIGVSCYFHGSALGGEGADYATATLKIENDYSVTLTSGLTDYGQGSRTVFTLIAAEGLGVLPERINILRPDTFSSIESGATVASRSTMVGGNATRMAAQNLDRLLVYAASKAFHCAPAQITRDHETYIGPNEEPLSFNEVVDRARDMGLVLSVSGKWQVPEIEWDFEKGEGVPYYCYTFGAQVAEVQVDTRTGETRVLHMWAAHDGGKVVFPQGAYGQMYGGMTMGMGYGLLEEMVYHNGYAQSLNYDGYLIPTALDVPPIDGIFIEKPHPDGPFGARNMAEPLMIAAAPAIGNAIFHATGKMQNGTPMTMEKVLLGRALVPGGAVRQARFVLNYPGS